MPVASNCTLQDAAGRVEACPGKPCPFWAGDACALDGAAAVLRTRPQVAQHLLELRLALGAPGTTNGRSLFYRLPDERPRAEGP